MTPPSSTETVTSITETTASQAVGSIILIADAKAVLEPTFDERAPYPAYLLYYGDHKPAQAFELYDYVDPGSYANKAKLNLLNNAKIEHLNPYTGTVIENVQISKLSKASLDVLALFVAERKLLVFCDQDFKDLSSERQTEIASHFDRLHVHPIETVVKGHLEQIFVYRDTKYNPFGNTEVLTVLARLAPRRRTASYEKQTPSSTFFWILDQPEVGGDTLFLSQVEVYNRLSPDFKNFLEGLKAVHSAVPQADFAHARGAPLIREPIVTEHPVTGKKALFVNEDFTQHIVGFKDEESKAFLGFLYNHITKDNRVVLHSAPDFDSNFVAMQLG
ncbi:hypothetical protein M422DRAFT_240357 [Sphaerobolus stellatus SS14]|nr:hypothetical protein M422DRAFT_240357 [Sphaerobolus stellatus SS14]